ncbi:DUF1254 domain-containing protein [Nocardia sp. NPDC003979]
MSTMVDVDNFTKVETNTMLMKMLPIIGGLGVFHHDRDLAPLDEQPVIRQNRDTLYSVAVVSIAEAGATLVVPDAGTRYLSVMVINQDHYINRVIHQPGSYALNRSEFGTDYLVIAARILFDPHDARDLAEVHRLQDGLTLDVGPQREFDYPDYDRASHQQVCEALLALGRTMNGFTRSFGSAGEVDPVIT